MSVRWFLNQCTCLILHLNLFHLFYYTIFGPSYIFLLRFLIPCNLQEFPVPKFYYLISVDSRRGGVSSYFVAHLLVSNLSSRFCLVTLSCLLVVLCGSRSFPSFLFVGRTNRSWPTLVSLRGVTSLSPHCLDVAGMRVVPKEVRVGGLSGSVRVSGCIPRQTSGVLP